MKFKMLMPPALSSALPAAFLTTLSFLSLQSVSAAPVKNAPSPSNTSLTAGYVALGKDDPGAAIASWRRFIQSAPGDPLSRALWPRFAALCEKTGRSDDLEGVVTSLLAKQSATPEIRAAARLVLLRAAQSSHRVRQARSLEENLDFLRDWRVIGPFDNVAHSGLQRVYAPESEVDFAKVLKGKDGQNVRWRKMPESPFVTASGTCFVGRYLGDDEPGVFYAATALRVATARTVQLRFNHSGAATLWLNGTPIFVDSTCRPLQNYDPDVLVATVKLNVGVNSILLKVAGDSATEASFSLRLSATNGSDLPSFAENFISEPARFAVAIKKIAIQSVKTPSTRSSMTPEDAAACATLTWAGRHLGEMDTALKTLSGYLTKKPQSPAWLWWEYAQALEDDGQTLAADVARSRVLQTDARFLPARLHSIANGPNMTAARVQKLKELLVINPQSPETSLALFNIYEQVGWKEETLSAASRMAALAPGADNLARLVGCLDVQGRKVEAGKTLERALESFPDAPSLLLQKARRLAARKDSDAAIVAYRRLVSSDTPSPEILNIVADLQKSTGDSKGVLATLQNLRALRPQDADAVIRLADALRERGEKTTAITLYREAIGLDPLRVALRDEVQALAGQKPLFELVPGLSAPVAGSVEKGTSGATLLLDEARQLVYPDRAVVTRFHQVIKINDVVAAQRYQHFTPELPTASARAMLEGVRITSTGGKTRDVLSEIKSPEIDAAGVDLLMLVPGDLLDISYRIEDFATGGLTRQFWTQWFFNLSGTPVQTSRFVLITPPDMTFNVRSHGEFPTPQTRDIKTGTVMWRVREWRLDNLAPRPMEALMPAAADGNLWLDISSIASWKQVAAWYRDLAGPRLVADAAVRAKAVQLTSNASNEDDKLRALYNFVARDLQNHEVSLRLSNYVPSESRQMLRENYGDSKDKAALLCALCGVIGLKARPALVNGREDGITPYLPSPRFNRVLVVVETKDGPLWLDPTADSIAFGELPANLQGVPALLIEEGTNTPNDLATTPIAAPEKNISAIRHNAQLDTSGKLSGTVDLSASGEWGCMLRAALHRLSPVQRNLMIANLTTRLLPRARPTSSNLQNLNDPELPLQVQFAYESPGFAVPQDESLAVKLPWEQGDGASALGNGAARTQDVEVASLRGLSLGTLKLQLPPGYTPADLPGEIRDETPFGRYRFSYKIEGNTTEGAGSALLATREVLLTPLRVEAKDASAYAVFLKAIHDETQRAIVLKK